MPDLAAIWRDAMRAGDYALAWRVSEQILAGRDPASRDDPSRPYHERWVWDGQPVDGKNALVRCYHGLGDTIQFARYLPRLAERAASVTLEVQPRLASLLSQLPGIDRLLPFDAAAPAAPSECDLEIMELAFALREPPARAPMPYLKSPAAPLPPETIGLCYEAGPWDPERSIDPALFEPICTDRPTLTLVSAPTELPVLNPQGCPFDMEATAALVSGVALVVTVDTMIAHLAGAMGKPTFLLLKAEPDWRWSPHRRGSDWYPSMRLYTQRTPGDWRDVLRQVMRDLPPPAAQDHGERPSSWKHFPAPSSPSPGAS
jgi:hypothetical protein